MNFRSQDSVGYDTPWRPNYEAKSAVCWGAACLLMLSNLYFFDLPKGPFIFMFVCAAGALAYRSKAAFGLWDARCAVGTQQVEIMKVSEFQEILRESDGKSVWFGRGFQWTPEHAAMAYELQKKSITKVAPPTWYLRAKGLSAPSLDDFGLGWIHGIGRASEVDIKVSREVLKQPLLMLGVTGAGKTAVYRLLAYQSIAAGEVLVVINPKRDDDLRNAVKAACALAGKPEKFIELSLSRPSTSIRYNALHNFNRETEVASRLQDVVEDISGSRDNFTAYIWATLQSISEALQYLGERATILTIRLVLEGGLESLLERVLERYFRENVPNWQRELEPLIGRERKADKHSPGMSPTLTAYVEYYSQLPLERKLVQINGFFDTVTRSRDHLGKMTTTLKPVLMALTAGEVGSLLSPDPRNLDDVRDIFDSKKVVKGGYALYIDLDTMSDDVVGQATAALIAADFKAVAGARFGDDNKKERETVIHFMIDEAGEAACKPVLQLVNKGRAANIRVSMTTQLTADLALKLGSELAARILTGNATNIITLRTRDGPTQDYITENFGETSIPELSRSNNSGTRSDDGGVHITGGEGKTRSDRRAPIFPKDLLGKLPNCEYVGLFGGAQIIKGRIPILQ